MPCRRWADRKYSCAAATPAGAPPADGGSSRERGSRHRWQPRLGTPAVGGRSGRRRGEWTSGSSRSRSPRPWVCHAVGVLVSVGRPRHVPRKLPALARGAMLQPKMRTSCRTGREPPVAVARANHGESPMTTSKGQLPGRTCRPGRASGAVCAGSNPAEGAQDNCPSSRHDAPRRRSDKSPYDTARHPLPPYSTGTTPLSPRSMGSGALQRRQRRPLLPCARSLGRSSSLRSIRHGRVGSRAGDPRRFERVSIDCFELTDMPKGGRRGENGPPTWTVPRDPMAQHRRGRSGAEDVGVIDVRPAGKHRMHQGQGLASAAGPTHRLSTRGSPCRHPVPRAPRRSSSMADNISAGVGDQMSSVVVPSRSPA